MKTVNGNGKKKYGNDSNLNNPLQRMKCISSPWGWIGRLVMNQVEDFKNFWMMHYPVCPVEISIVNE